MRLEVSTPISQTIILAVQVPHGLNSKSLHDPEGPSTQYLRFLDPNTIKSMVVGTKSLHDIPGGRGHNTQGSGSLRHR